MHHASTQQISAWLDRMAGGDQTSLGELLSHLGGRLRAVASRARSRLSSDAGRVLETDDVLQDLVVRLLPRCATLSERLRSVPPTERVRFFFGCTARIIRDLICEEARRPTRRVQLSSGDGWDNSDSAGSALEALAAHESESPQRMAMWADFHDFVNGLPDGLREVVDLHWYHGLTHNEVGETLGIAEVTSRSRWAQVRHRAIQQFPESPFEWSRS